MQYPKIFQQGYLLFLAVEPRSCKTWGRGKCLRVISGKTLKKRTSLITQIEWDESRWNREKNPGGPTASHRWKTISTKPSGNKISNKVVWECFVSFWISFFPLEACQLLDRLVSRHSDIIARETMIYSKSPVLVWEKWFLIIFWGYSGISCTAVDWWITVTWLTPLTLASWAQFLFMASEEVWGSPPQTASKEELQFKRRAQRLPQNQTVVCCLED